MILAALHGAVRDHGRAVRSPPAEASGPAELLSPVELVARAQRRVAELRSHLGSPATPRSSHSAGVVAVAGGQPIRQLVDLLAALELGYPVLACHGGWWPRERDAVLERLRPARLVEAEGSIRDLPPPGRTDPARRLWLGSAASLGEPTPYAFDEDQLQAHWLVPDPAVQAGQSVVISGEPAHAPTLRFALGAVCAGASVRFVDRKTLLAVVASEPVDHLCTTPALLRRVLHQLRRRSQPVRGVGRTVLHQGPWRSHEHGQWPERLSGRVEPRVSATEAGGWVLEGPRPAPGVNLQLLAPPGAASAAGHPPEATMHIAGPAAATNAGGSRDRPRHGWDSGDVAHAGEDGTMHWVRRQRDRFEVAGHLVDPLAIEAVLGSHPLVAEVVVAPRPDPELGNIVVAVVVPANPEWPPFVEDLAECSQSLASYARVRALAIVDDVPLNAAGAVHRRLVNYEEAGR